jgi:methyl-accepting chemotaxis protein
MRNRLKISIAKRIAAGYIALIVSMLIVALIGWNAIRLSTDKTRQMTNVDLPLERLVDEWVSAIKLNSTRTLAIVRSTDEPTRQYFKQQMVIQSARVNEIQKELEQKAVNNEERALFADIAQIRKEYFAIREDIFKAQSMNNTTLVMRLLETKFQPALETYIGKAENLKKFKINRVDAVTANLGNELNTGRSLLLFISVLALVLSIAICIYTTRKITIPLRHAVDVAIAIAAGRLDSKIESQSSDEAGRLLNELRLMQNNLCHIIGETQDAAHTISEVAGQVASGNSDLSIRTENQAAAIEETMSSMEELISTVKQNASNAQQLNQMADGAAELALKGGEMVGRMVSTMSEISESSKKVADIIAVIDTIAFQTNILALNAAVEAARAGEQGRGFAVVAGEVRNLALQSTTASKEIKLLIQSSGEKVENGYILAGQAGTAMREIVDNIKNVADIITEIAGASEEQSSGIEQVNQAILQMNEVTQKNALLVEEASTSAGSMTQQAQRLIETVSAFRR